MFFDFRKECLPENWLIETNKHSFSNEGLDSGQIMVVKTRLPEELPECYEIEFSLYPKGMLWISDDTYGITIDFIRNEVMISHGRSKLKTSQLTIPEGRDFLKIKLFFSLNKLEFSIDDNEILSTNKPVTTLPSSLYTIGFYDGCLIRSFQDNINMEMVSSSTDKNDKKPFHLEVNVDFYDDLVHAPFTSSMIEQMFDEFKSWGLKRCHWIYYGGQKNGWWSNCPSPVRENARKTFDKVGDIFTAAVKAAHKRGIELYGLIKPFDMGLQYTLSPQECKLGKLNTINGPLGWIADFPAEHREFITCRREKDCGVDQYEKITRIDLIKNNNLPAVFNVNDLEIYVSEDNVKYQRYNGPIKRTEVVENHDQWTHAPSGGHPSGQIVKALVMRLSELNIGTKFIAVKVNQADNSFGNRLVDIIHVFGEKGESRKLSYGITSRKMLPKNRNNFMEIGVEFDYWPGTPSAVFAGFNPMEEIVYLDGKEGFIGIAREKEHGALAILSPSFPETRKWWLSWVEDILNAEADGVELRVRNHHSHLTWDEYGFEQPVVNEFKSRYGVDLNMTDDFDQGLWRKLRGEAYTQFYQEAKKLVAQRGKKLGLHISTTMNMPPETAAAMNIHWDWKTWLDKRLADVVTLKEVWPGTPFAKEVMIKTEEQKVPVVFCPYANNLFSGGKNGVEVCANRISLAREAGLDGFQFYECAAVIRGNPDGEIKMLQPDLRELFAKNF